MFNRVRTLVSKLSRRRDLHAGEREPVHPHSALWRNEDIWIGLTVPEPVHEPLLAATIRYACIFGARLLGHRDLKTMTLLLSFPSHEARSCFVSAMRKEYSALTTYLPSADEREHAFPLESLLSLDLVARIICTSHSDSISERLELERMAHAHAQASSAPFTHRMQLRLAELRKMDC